MDLKETIFAATIFFVMTFIISLPSFDLSIAQFTEPPIKIIQPKSSGETIVISNVPNNLQTLFNSAPLSKITENTYLFSLGIHQKNTTTVSFFYKAPKPSILKKILPKITNPTTLYSFQKLYSQSPFHKKQIKKGNNLRLPASVWKKVRKKLPSDITYKKKLKEITKKYSTQSLNQVSKQTSQESLVPTCWQSPLEKNRVNSAYARPRNLPNGYTYYHSGVDLKARSGTPVRAPANGEVVISEHVTVPGNTVLINHGGGVQSQVMHLNKITVTNGQRVKKGDTIGLSGATGRVEGPHLHWEIHWNGKKTSPLGFVAALSDYCGQE